MVGIGFSLPVGDLELGEVLTEGRRGRPCSESRMNIRGSSTSNRRVLSRDGSG
jgi:hypothetical protein